VGGRPDPGRDRNPSDQFEAHTNHACQGRIDFPAGSNLREEYSAWSQERDNEGADFRQRGHRPGRSEIERVGHSRLALYDLLRPPEHRVDAGQCQQANDVTKKRDLLPRDFYQREIKARSCDGDWDGGKTGSRSDVQGSPRTQRDQGGAGKRIEKAVPYDLLGPCQGGETHTPRPPENLLPIDAKRKNLLRS
jgi:hypothetical protein